jgi:hypothetical protein
MIGPIGPVAGTRVAEELPRKMCVAPVELSNVSSENTSEHKVVAGMEVVT